MVTEGTGTTPPLMVTVKEAARLLSLNPDTVYELVYTGVLPRRWIGKTRFRIPTAAVVAYAESLPSEKPSPERQAS